MLRIEFKGWPTSYKLKISGIVVNQQLLLSFHSKRMEEKRLEYLLISHNQINLWQQNELQRS